MQLCCKAKQKMINYHNRTFRPVSQTTNSETTEETLFLYQQEGDLLFCTYKGGDIVYGHLIGKVDAEGKIDMRYHQLNVKGELNTGICNSTPELKEDGTLTIHEEWQWTSGSRAKGKSMLVEVIL